MGWRMDGLRLKNGWAEDGWAEDGWAEDEDGLS